MTTIEAKKRRQTHSSRFRIDFSSNQPTHAIIKTKINIHTQRESVANVTRKRNRPIRY